MAPPTSALESAAITRCRDDAPLQGLLGNPSHAAKNVFDADSVPVGYESNYITVALPLETIGEAETASLDAFDSYIYFSIYTKSSGSKDARAIFERVHYLFNRKPLTIAGFNQFFLKFRDKQEKPQDGIWQQIIAVFKCMTQDV